MTKTMPAIQDQGDFILYEREKSTRTFLKKKNIDTQVLPNQMRSFWGGAQV
jgi:hypothetical protein